MAMGLLEHDGCAFPGGFIRTVNGYFETLVILSGGCGVLKILCLVLLALLLFVLCLLWLLYVGFKIVERDLKEY
jgi:hypothetical protein